MTPTSPSDKPKEVMPRGVLFTVVGVIVVTALYGIAQRTSDLWVAKVDVPIVGEWRAAFKPWRIVFRPDKTVDSIITDPSLLSANDESAPGEPGQGAYWLGSGGKVAIKMKSGKLFTVEWKAISPNRFDLIDAETEGVTTFHRAPDAGPK